MSDDIYAIKTSPLFGLVHKNILLNELERRGRDVCDYDQV